MRSIFTLGPLDFFYSNEDSAGKPVTLVELERKTYEQHPEGWFAFCIRSCEATESEFKGKKTLRFTWKVESTERDSEGARFLLNVYTGRDLVNDERCKLKQLVEACGIPFDELEDTDELEGKVFAGKVKAGEGEKSGFCAIVAFDTKDRVRKAPAKTKEAEEDPFEDQ